MNRPLHIPKANYYSVASFSKIDNRLATNKFIKFMDKFKKSQILKLFLVAILLSLTPTLPTSSRPHYLYFVVNLLIIALGAEAGLLSFIYKAAEDKKSAAPVSQKTLMITTANSDIKLEESEAKTTNLIEAAEPTKKMPKAVEKCSSEKIVSVVKVQYKSLKKCPSTPSIFFIGGGDQTNADAEEELAEDDEEEVIGELSGQELFHKAETFIGNFYKQLKMQREDSWKKIHGLYLYHKAY